MHNRRSVWRMVEVEVTHFWFGRLGGGILSREMRAEQEEEGMGEGKVIALRRKGGS